MGLCGREPLIKRIKPPGCLNKAGNSTEVAVFNDLPAHGFNCVHCQSFAVVERVIFLLKYKCGWIASDTQQDIDVATGRQVNALVSKITLI